MTDNDSPMLEVKDLRTWFPIRSGVFSRVTAHVKAVDGVSFQLGRRETLGLVGESGCGKTTVGRSILRLVEPTSGKVTFDGQDVGSTEGAEMRKLRKRMQIIFQDPYGSLNPRMTRVDEYPHQLSGGMKQRVMIAMALACSPSLLIADEPTTALDVTIQAQILDLLRDLQKDKGMAILLITHDLGVVAENADDVVVMYAGKIVERAPVEQLFETPRHPYTLGLFRSIPGLGSACDRLEVIEGSVPNPLDFPSGCKFRPRCPFATEECAAQEPELSEVAERHEVACLHLDEVSRSTAESQGGGV